MNPSARFRGWVREVSQNGTLTLLFLWRAALDLVTKTHPTAFSVRRLIVFLDLLAAIGRVANADENLAVCLYFASCFVFEG